MENQYILPSGVKGMKWGVRKKTNKKASRYSSYSPWLLGSLGAIGGMSIVDLQYADKK